MRNEQHARQLPQLTSRLRLPSRWLFRRLRTAELCVWCLLQAVASTNVTSAESTRTSFTFATTAIRFALAPAHIALQHAMLCAASGDHGRGDTERVPIFCAWLLRLRRHRIPLRWNRRNDRTTIQLRKRDMRVEASTRLQLRQPSDETGVHAVVQRLSQQPRAASVPSGCSMEWRRHIVIQGYLCIHTGVARDALHARSKRVALRRCQLPMLLHAGRAKPTSFPRTATCTTR